MGSIPDVLEIRIGINMSQNEELPIGLGFSMAMNEEAMKKFANMTEEQKRNVITQSKLAASKDDMSQLVDRIASDSFQG